MSSQPEKPTEPDRNREIELLRSARSECFASSKPGSATELEEFERREREELKNSRSGNSPSTSRSTGRFKVRDVSSRALNFVNCRTRLSAQTGICLRWCRAVPTRKSQTTKK